VVLAPPTQALYYSSKQTKFKRANKIKRRQFKIYWLNVIANLKLKDSVLILK